MGSRKIIINEISIKIKETIRKLIKIKLKK